MSMKKLKNLLLAKNCAPLSYGEAFSCLRVSILPLCAQKELKTILIASPAPGDGRTTVAINLAVSLAGEGGGVLLLDADFRSPAIHRYLLVPPQNGLTTLLAGQCALNDSLAYFRDLRITVLPSGPAVKNPAEIACSQKLGELIDTLRDRFDYIVIDSPPLLNCSDAAAVARFSDAAALVVRQGRTQLDAAARAKTCLESAGTDVIGCIYNAFDRRSSNRPEG